MTHLLNFILTSGILLNTCALALHLRRNKGSIGARILGIVFLLLLIVSLNSYAEVHEIELLYIVTFIPNELAEWLVSPLLLHFIFRLFNRPMKASLKAFLITAPLAVFLFITIPFVITLITDEQLFPHISYLMTHPHLYVFLGGLFNIALLIYCHQTIRSGTRKIEEFVSFKNTFELWWLNGLIVSLIVVFIIDILSELYELFIVELTWDASLLTVVMLILFTIYLSYFSFKNIQGFIPSFLWKQKQKKKSNLKEDLALERNLKNIMTIKQPYLNPELTLSELADLAAMKDKHLSEFLNHQIGSSFYEFVNDYRLQHFIELLDSGQLEKRTIFGLAQDSGFKSKTTFNRLFKVKYSCTPGEFIRRVSS